MIDPYPIVPFKRPLAGTLVLPGSKSITNRALILAALAKGTTRLQGALFSRDTEIMLAALDTLGFETQINTDDFSITVRGEEGSIPKKEGTLNVGNAGTAARFLTAFLALETDASYTLDGDPAMRERPMSGLLQALEGLGAASFDFHGKPGHFPFTLKAYGYKGGCVTVDASASSQILSALLLAAPAGPAAIQLIAPRVRPAYVGITLAIREAFGADATQADEVGAYLLPAINYKAPANNCYAIEPDLSAASYFLALTTIHGGQLAIPNLNPDPIQGDAQFLNILEKHGLTVQKEQSSWLLKRAIETSISEPTRELDFENFSDTFLTYAAIAPLLGGSVTLKGIGHTRYQETDRIAGMANELNKLGQLTKETKDSLRIVPNLKAMQTRALAARAEGNLLEIETYEDHRFAMSFAILGSFDLLDDGQPWLTIKDPACCGKTFPNFFSALKKLQNDSD